MNNDVLFSSAKEEWETPQSFFDVLNDEFHFDIDVCALPENAKCSKFYSPEDNGLSKNWGVLVGVIRRMAERSENGLKRQVKATQPLLCFFRQERTQNGFTNTYMEKLKFDL